MYIYVFLFVIISILAYTNNQKFWFKPIMFILFIMCAFRAGYVDRDYQNYVILMDLSVSDPLLPVEPTFKIISWIALKVFGGGIFLFLVYAAISFTFKIKYIQRNSHYLMLSVLVFYSNIFLLHDMTQIRVAVASIIAFYSLQYIVAGKQKKFVLFILIASSFHITALIFLIALNLRADKITKRFLLIYIMLLITAYAMFYTNINILTVIEKINIDYIQAKYIQYIKRGNSDEYIPINIFSLFQLIHIAITFLLFYIIRGNLVSKEIILTAKLYSFAPIALVAFSIMPVFSLRISELFSVAEIILLPYCAYKIKPKMLSLSLVVFICAIMFYINIFHVELLGSYEFYS